MRYFFVLIVILLAGCVDKGTHSDSSSATTRIDKTADKIYKDLMDQILGSKIESVGNGSSNRAGMVNPYRKGLGSAHKALAACLIWDVEKKEVKFKVWNSSGNRDWNYAQLGAFNNCENYKLQRSLNCNCQTVDHDDENVLYIPADFRRAYENRAVSVAAATPAKLLNSNEKRFYLDVAWENLLETREVYSVMVKQVGRVGYVKSASLIGGKTCDAVFRYDTSGRGDWEVNCTDGTRAVGVLQTQGKGKGSKGTGFDTAENKIDFAITHAPSSN